MPLLLYLYEDDCCYDDDDAFEEDDSDDVMGCEALSAAERNPSMLR